MSDGFIPPHGGYARLLSYRKAEIIYDAIICFCNRFLERRDGPPVRWFKLRARESRMSARAARPHPSGEVEL